VTQCVRAIGEADLPLVYSSYIKSSPTGGIAYSEHCSLAHDRMERCLSAENVVAMCVVDGDAPGWVGAWLVGHAVTGGLAVHYMYVKRDYRRLKLATQLLAYARLDEPGELYITSTVAPRWRSWAERLGAAHVPLSRAIQGVEACRT